jgi:hypothetical protein
MSKYLPTVVLDSVCGGGAGKPAWVELVAGLLSGRAYGAAHQASRDYMLWNKVGGPNGTELGIVLDDARNRLAVKSERLHFIHTKLQTDRIFGEAAFK